jgi:hypothetical protein
VYWESLGVGSDPDGDDGRGIATELPVSYIFDKLKREIEALGMENNLKLNLHKLRKIGFRKAWDAPTDRETSLPIDGRKIEILSWICNFLHLHLFFHIIQHNDFWRSGARRSHRSIQRPFSTLNGRLPASPRSRHNLVDRNSTSSGKIRNEIQAGDGNF